MEELIKNIKAMCIYEEFPDPNHTKEFNKCYNSNSKTIANTNNKITMYYNNDNENYLSNEEKLISSLDNLEKINYNLLNNFEPNSNLISNTDTTNKLRKINQNEIEIFKVISISVIYENDQEKFIGFKYYLIILNF
ncbi:hypothetical protein BCR32DRAFT_286367 [Anaeromyces robustus]|uniref:Uncharacterized protein n=1 Tax=Anaeromyces robustus TaxID=1754192 RepID=A0A1Y1VYI5_9FUNG|nr:hypothetical protein BCR32DRAFT_286367 [Anaeromyces robustus]|eukprot:ORX66095.1 hypothetical protein BCR32DRAFT_286367 [Anaeromyces robustus]